MSAQIETTIARVEQLYQTVTGRDVPQTDGPYSPIPPEAEPGRYVEEQLARLLELVEGREPRQPTWSPAISVRRDGGDLVIEVELAGMDRSAVDVAATRNLLTIQGVRPPGPALQSSERPFGRFFRAITLPDDARAGQMTAHMRDGLLTIRIPRTASEQPHEVPIDV